MQIRIRCLVHSSNDRAHLIPWAACALVHAMFACPCVCFLLGPLNFWRKPRSHFLLKERRPSIKIKSHYLCGTTCDNLVGHHMLESWRAKGIPILSYRPTTWLLIKVIQCHACRGNNPSDSMNPQRLDNRGHYHLLLLGDIRA